MSDDAVTLAKPGSYTAAEPHLLSRGQTRAALLAIILLVAGGLWTLRPFLPALGWGTILTVSLWPWYQRQCARWPRARRVLLPAGVTFLAALAFILPLVMVVSAIAHDSVGLLQWLQQARDQGVPAPDVLHHLPMGDRLVTWWNQELSQPGAFGQLARGHGGASALPIGAGGRFVGEVARRVLLIVFTLLVMFFLLRDGESVARALQLGSRRAFGPAGENVGEQIIAAIRGTVNGLVVVGFGEGIILGFAYEVAGVPHPALFGLLTALLSAVPLGSVLAFLAAAGLLAGEGVIGPAIALLVLGAVVVFIADHFVRPVLIGEATRLPFPWVLLGILGGVEAWGLIGLVLGPALMAALMLLWREWTGMQRGPLNPAPEPAGPSTPLS